MGLFGRNKRDRGDAADDPVRQVRTEAELSDAIGEGTAVIYKHSNRCGICFRTLKEVRKFGERNPGVPVVMIDVVADRPLSDLVADRYGVKHESPQAIVVSGGAAVWSASHLGVTAGALEVGSASSNP